MSFKPNLRRFGLFFSSSSFLFLSSQSLSCCPLLLFFLNLDSQLPVLFFLHATSFGSRLNPTSFFFCGKLTLTLRFLLGGTGFGFGFSFGFGCTILFFIVLIVRGRSTRGRSGGSRDRAVIELKVRGGHYTLLTV